MTNVLKAHNPSRCWDCSARCEPRVEFRRGNFSSLGGAGSVKSRAWRAGVLRGISSLWLQVLQRWRRSWHRHRVVPREVFRPPTCFPEPSFTANEAIVRYARSNIVASAHPARLLRPHTALGAAVDGPSLFDLSHQVPSAISSSRPPFTPSAGWRSPRRVPSPRSAASRVRPPLPSLCTHRRPSRGGVWKHVLYSHEVEAQVGRGLQPALSFTKLYCV